MFVKTVLFVMLLHFIFSCSEETDDPSYNLGLSILRRLKDLGDNSSCSRSCAACMPSSNHRRIERRLFFLHIPKTGGLSVEMDIRRVVCGGNHLVKNDCFCGRNHSQFANLRNGTFHYKSSTKQYGWRNFSVFSGHEYWGMIPGFVGEAAPVTATMLREPISRALSHWNMAAGRSLGFDNSRNVTFSEAVRQSIADFGFQKTLGHMFGSAIRNEQIRYLCGVDCPDSMPVSTAVSISKLNLARTAIVGIFDDFDGLLDQFRSVLSWWPSKYRFRQFSKINAASEHRNVLRRRYHKKTQLDDLDMNTAHLLREFLAPEFEVYEYAKKLAAVKTAWARSCASVARARKCSGFTSDCF